MGEVTTLALNAPNKASLRTTIPMFIVKQWGLKAGDKLDWSLEARKNEVIIVVRMAESKKKKKMRMNPLRLLQCQIMLVYY